MDLSILPNLNASLNTTSAVLLVFGFAFIRKQKVNAHKVCMLAAFSTSTLFLTSYLYYHYHHGSTPFQGTGGIRVIYFTILISHTVLAVITAPLVLVTLYRALEPLGPGNGIREIARGVGRLASWVFDRAASAAGSRVGTRPIPRFRKPRPMRPDRARSRDRTRSIELGARRTVDVQ